MRGTTRTRALACFLGQHKRGAVSQINRRLYSECHHCGSDLIRKGRRWHRAGADELPAGWKAQQSPGWTLPPSLLAVAAFAILGTVIFLMQR